MIQKTWFTPEGIEDLLPQQAHQLEYYRRQLLDGFNLSGYDLVLPPVAEFTDSLLTGTGSQMARETCRFTDQESGKMMGVRTDMTPKVARLVANRLKNQAGIIRLCYVGEVLKSKNNKAKGSRSPIQIGAELFGDSGIESDIEVIDLMLDSIMNLNLTNLNLSLGHVGLVNQLMALAGMSDDQQSELVDILLRKAKPEYEAFVAGLSLSNEMNDAFIGLLNLAGDAEKVIADAKTLLASVSEEISLLLERVSDVVKMIQTHYPSVQIHLDLSDLRGYRYHTGIIFACYSVGQKLYPIATGGRYDGIANSFGSSQPATGFSMDLRSALDLLADAPNTNKSKVFIPTLDDVSLMEKVKSLKADGYRVIRQLSNSDIPADCHKLEKQGAQWVLVNA